MILDKVDYPFNDRYKHAYLIINGEGRRTICLTSSDFKDRLSMAYARYLMSIKLGRILTENEQVDHIDNDKTNDSLDNLQLLSPDANRQKYQATQPHNVHGTNSMYRSGCRCDICRKWKHDYWQSYRARHSR